MKKLQFPIDSDLLELLVAFDEAPTLQRLAKIMCRDTSVVSRGLARLGQSGHVLAKKQRKWVLTPAGRKLVKLTKAYVRGVEEIVASRQGDAPRLPPRACLMVINAQRALQSPSLGKSSNAHATKHIKLALETWRRAELPVIHAKHVSENPKSVFFRGSVSGEFMAGLEPAFGERVLEKGQPSAFAATDLAKTLDKLDARTVVIAGFTAQECIDSTAKHAVAIGLEVWVVEDAIAQFEVTAPSGKVFKADVVHEIVVSGLSATAKIVNVRQLAAMARG